MRVPDDSRLELRLALNEEDIKEAAELAARGFLTHFAGALLDNRAGDEVTETMNLYAVDNVLYVTEEGVELMAAVHHRAFMDRLDGTREWVGLDYEEREAARVAMLEALELMGVVRVPGGHGA